VVRCSEEDDTTSRMNDILEMSFRSPTRRDQSLSRPLARFSKNQRRTVHPRRLGHPSYGRQILWVVHSACVSTVVHPSDQDQARTVSSSSRYDARAVNKFHAWFAIRFCDTTPRQSATYASYPNVRMRVVGSLEGRRVLGHGSDASSAVHVLSRSPVRPCTKTMLGRVAECLEAERGGLFRRRRHRTQARWRAIMVACLGFLPLLEELTHPSLR
jgi:hypothetical protein